MSDFNKIKIQFNKEQFGRKLIDFEQKGEQIQIILNNLKDVAPEIIINNDNVVQLFDDPKIFLVDQLVKEPMIIGGIELNKLKVFDLLSCANDLSIIISKINQISVNLGHYIISQDGTIEIKEDFKQDLEYQYSLFITNEKQKQIYESIHIIKAEFEKIKALTHRSEEKIFNDFFTLNSNGDLIEINNSEFLRLN